MLSVFRTTFTTIFMFLSLMVFATSYVFAQSERNYAYLVINGDNRNDILIINADDPEAAATRKNYPVAEGWALTRQVSLSPDGEWMTTALLSTDQRRLTIQLYNLVSGESREVIQGRISTEGQNIAWSPDGRYLALNVAQEPGSLNTFLYSVADGKLTNLTNDNEDHDHIGWSFTSTHLVTFTETCPDKATLCNGKVELFDLVNGRRETSPDLPILFLDSIGCKSVISPDARLVAFVAHCSPYPEVTTDVYLWDVAAATITQVTDFFAAETPLHATYHLAWLDTQKLLVGVDYQLYKQPIAYQLTTYDGSKKLLETLSTAVGTSFALSPTADQIALRLHATTAEESAAELNDQIAIFPIDNLTANTHTLNMGTSTTNTSIPSGCGLSWSANGIVSYPTHAEGECQGKITGFVFIDTTSKELGTHTVAADGVRAGVILPLGWVAN